MIKLIAATSGVQLAGAKLKIDIELVSDSNSIMYSVEISQSGLLSSTVVEAVRTSAIDTASDQWSIVALAEEVLITGGLQ